jgi:hypothetical protein
VQRGREAIFAWGGIQRRLVIDKGDGSYLTSGYAKDALWTARRIAEANQLGLNTADFWEAKPVDIQGKINQAKLAIARGEAPEAAAIDYEPPAGQPQQPSRSKEVDQGDNRGSLSPELMEQAKREAWYRARYELAGPTNWTHYWDAAQKARGFEGLPKWMLDLESNWRVPPPEVMAQQEEEAARQAVPPAAPSAHYSPQAPGVDPRSPWPAAPPANVPQPGESIDRGFSRPLPNRPVDPGFSQLVPGPYQPPPGGLQPTPMPYSPQPGAFQVVPVGQPPMADPRVAEQARLQNLAARWAASEEANPGVLKDRAQRAWDQRRRASKARAEREFKNRR